MASKFPSSDDSKKISDSEDDIGSEDNDSENFNPDDISEIDEDDELFQEFDDAQTELEELHLEELSSVKSKLYTMESRMKDINRELIQIRDCMEEKHQEEDHPVVAGGDSIGDDDDDDDDEDDQQEEDPITQVSRLTEELQNFTNQMRADKRDLDHRLEKIEEALNRLKPK